jgi:hypothetical protein
MVELMAEVTAEVTAELIAEVIAEVTVEVPAAELIEMRAVAGEEGEEGQDKGVVVERHFDVCCLKV